MNVKQLIEKYKTKGEALKEFPVVAISDVLKDLRELDEPEKPIRLKDVIKRIQGFDDETKFKWTYDILQELGSDFGSKIFHEAYQQGKFEGSWVGNQLKDADKIRQELNKPVVKQFVADWIEVCKEHLTTSLYTAMNPNFMKENNQSFDLILWIKKTSNQETFARAWLDGYEVEKEKRYVVSLKNGQPLTKTKSGKAIYFNQDIIIGNYKFTRKELYEYGFGWVFDCLGIEVEEVEE